MGAALIGAIVYTIHRRRQEKARWLAQVADFVNRRSQQREALIAAIDRHRAALSRNLERAVKTNDYGAVVSDRTEQALDEFLGSVGADTNLMARDDMTALIRERLRELAAADLDAGFDPSSLPSGGHDFEHWVAEQLAAFGWKADVTRGSGDQGIDVLAERDGKRVGIQCKLYQGPVGNKAVQEAYAGRAYYALDIVAVLSNAPFTPSAIALGAATGVLLFSHHDIPNLFEQLA